MRLPAPSSLLPAAIQFLLISAVLAADAPQTRPATQPATTPSTQPAGSLASPRDALKWFAGALRDGDVPRLRRVMLGGNEVENRMIGAMGEMSAALAGLHASAVKVFGAPAAEQFTDDAAAHFNRVLARIDAAAITINGDTATVRYPDDKPYELRQVAGEWRLPVAQFSQGVPPAVLERRVAELRTQTRIVNEMSREILAQKHRSADAAMLAWRGKMMSAAVTTGPTTRPASGPETKPGK